MKTFIRVTLVMLSVMASFTSCRDNDDDITPSGNYSPIRGGFPQGDSEWDDIIYDIKQEYGVYLLYKNVTEEDMNRTWESAGTSDIIIAGDSLERDKGAWDLPEEQLPYYVNFFRNYIFPNITKEFANSTFPIKIYMIDNLRTEPRKYGVDDDNDEEDSEESSTEPGTDTNPNKIIHFGEFDNWIISFPDSIVNGTGVNEEESEELLKRLRCRFMINIIKKSIEDKRLVIPTEFWNKYDMNTSSTCHTDNNHDNCSMIDVANKENTTNGLYTLGYVDVMEEKFGMENSDSIFKNTDIFHGKPAHAQNWNSSSMPTWNLFEAYIMNAMWFTPEEFNEYYKTDKYTLIGEQYEYVVEYLKEFGIDLVGIARGEKEEEKE